MHNSFLLLLQQFEAASDLLFVERREHRPYARNQRKFSNVLHQLFIIHARKQIQDIRKMVGQLQTTIVVSFTVLLFHASQKEPALIIFPKQNISDLKMADCLDFKSFKKNLFSFPEIQSQHVVRIFFKLDQITQMQHFKLISQLD
ncbi:MAG: hypothetical protein B7X31_01010 [Thiomonas sp. 13-66-29]|nr:MAG: hypothetical protein B7X46_08565 [Thiomonas sp. 15-66-11]OZB65869.1 MAG: hypothetical protein B7X31_01010 [Thiomonas sp. 13-66-29]